MKNTKNSLKVGKNGLKVRFDLVWWVLYCALLFVGGHDENFRELNWGKLSCLLSSVL